MFYLIMYGLLFISGLLFYLNNKYQKDSRSNKITKSIKVILITWMILSFINLFLPDGISARTYPDQSLYNTGKNLWFVLLRWANDLALLILPIAIFFKKATFKRIAVFFLSVINIICIASYTKYIAMYTNGLGQGIMNIRFFSQATKDFFINITFRSIYLGILLYLEGLLIIYVGFTSYKELKFTNKKDIKNFFLVLLGTFLAIMPIYAPSYLTFGYFVQEQGKNLMFVLGTPWHFAWIVYIVIEGFVLYHIFKKLDSENRYIAMLVLALALFYEFNGIFTCFGEIVTQRYPLQLCNIAALFILIMLLTKNKYLTKFVLVVNTLGAVIAVIMLDSANAGISYIMNVHFIVEHTKILLIPFLSLALGVINPLEKKDIKTVIIGFTIYFVTILIIGGVFTGIYDKTGNTYFQCNYLFMFNKKSTTSIVGFVGPLFDMNIKLFNFFTLSMVQLLVYVAYTLLSVGMFYLVYAIQKHLPIYKKISNEKNA